MGNDSRAIRILVPLVVLLVLAAVWAFSGSGDGGAAAVIPGAEAAGPRRAGGPDAVPTDERRASGDAASGSKTAATDRGQRAGHGSLLVRVLWSDGTPAADVTIRVSGAWPALLPGGTRRAISADDGLARVSELPPGKISIRSDREGSAKAEIEAGKTTEVDFRLPAGVEVTGTVVTTAGSPVAGAGIWLTTGHTDWLGGRVVARSNADGSFRVRAVPKDESLGAIAVGHTRSKLVDLDELDTKDGKVAIRLELEPGGATLDFRVVTPDHSPVAGALVAVGKMPRHMPMRVGWLSVREVWTPQVVETDEQGRARVIGMPPGEQPVAARATGFPIWTGTIMVEAFASRQKLIVLEKPVVVRGKVTDPKGEAVAKAVVRAVPEAFDEVFLQSGQFDFEGVFGDPSTLTDANGHYRLDTVAPGEAHLYAQEPSRSRHGWTTRIWVSTVLPAPAGVEIVWNPVLSPGNTITGIVTFRDGPPMKNVFVTAQEASGKRYVINAGEDGRFKFVNLSPVAHTLSVQLWNPPKGTPPLTKSDVWPNQGDVRLVGTYDAPVEQPPGVVTGRVRDAGKRLAHASALKVSLTSDQRWWRSDAKVDGESFRFDRVMPGRYRIVARSGEDVIAVGDWFDVGPSQEVDSGMLTTELGGSALVRLERSPAAAQLEPTVYLSRAGGYHDRRVKLGRGHEQLVDNLSPGKYTYSIWGDNVAGARGELEVVAGRTTTVAIEVRLAVTRTIEISYTAGSLKEHLDVKVLDASGKPFWEIREKNLGALARPYRRKISLPTGRYTLAAESGSGVSGRVQFDVSAMTTSDTPVRVQLR